MSLPDDETQRAALKAAWRARARAMGYKRPGPRSDHAAMEFTQGFRAALMVLLDTEKTAVDGLVFIISFTGSKALTEEDK